MPSKIENGIYVMPDRSNMSGTGKCEKSFPWTTERTFIDVLVKSVNGIHKNIAQISKSL